MFACARTLAADVTVCKRELKPRQQRTLASLAPREGPTGQSGGGGPPKRGCEIGIWCISRHSDFRRYSNGQQPVSPTHALTHSPLISEKKQYKQLDTMRGPYAAAAWLLLLLTQPQIQIMSTGTGAADIIILAPGLTAVTYCRPAAGYRGGPAGSVHQILGTLPTVAA